jgi:dolichol-phosphate mannosyltransferase
MKEDRLLIFIPTYNESENIENIYREIKQLNLHTDLLFLDDNSPDGTGKIIDRLAKNDKSIFVIHRDGKQGIGSAHKKGIQWAYDHHYKILITMDCDFTHSPSSISDFIKAGENSNIVVGSRFLQENSLATWNLFRKSLTHLGHFLTVNLLKMPYDASGAFRFYNLENINPQLFGKVQSSGYSFFFESLFIMHFNKIGIAEVPIDLPARTYGHSKMSWKDAWRSLQFLFSLYIRKSFRKKSLK